MAVSPQSPFYKPHVLVFAANYAELNFIYNEAIADIARKTSTNPVTVEQNILGKADIHLCNEIV